MEVSTSTTTTSSMIPLTQPWLRINRRGDVIFDDTSVEDSSIEKLNLIFYNEIDLHNPQFHLKRTTSGLVSSGSSSSSSSSYAKNQWYHRQKYNNILLEGDDSFYRASTSSNTNNNLLDHRHNIVSGIDHSRNHNQNNVIGTSMANNKQQQQQQQEQQKIPYLEQQQHQQQFKENNNNNTFVYNNNNNKKKMDNNSTIMMNTNKYSNDPDKVVECARRVSIYIDYSANRCYRCGWGKTGPHHRTNASANTYEYCTVPNKFRYPYWCVPQGYEINDIREKVGPKKVKQQWKKIRQHCGIPMNYNFPTW